MKVTRDGLMPARFMWPRISSAASSSPHFKSPSIRAVQVIWLGVQSASVSIISRKSRCASRSASSRLSVASSTTIFFESSSSGSERVWVQAERRPDGGKRVNRQGRQRTTGKSISIRGEQEREQGQSADGSGHHQR